MIITKENQSNIGLGKLYLHDKILQQFDFDMSQKALYLKIQDGIDIIFHNVVNLTFKRNKEKIDSDFTISEWEEIPNNACNDQYLLLKKDELVFNNLWTDDLFAVRIVFSNFDQIKLICESIDFLN